MPVKKFFSGLFPKCGLKTRNNFQADALRKPENSITFSSSAFGKNTAKAFRDSRYVYHIFFEKKVNGSAAKSRAAVCRKS